MKSKVLALHVVLPILVGGLIYVCWRDPGLVMFKWFRQLGCEPVILQLRLATASTRSALPSWLIYSLPDGLWVYALTSFMTYVWSGSRASFLKIACLAVGPVLGAGSELGQLAHIVPGSFDWIDFVFYLSAATIAFVVASRSTTKSKEARSINEQSTQENITFVSRVGGLSTTGVRQRVLDEQKYFEQ